MPTRTVPVRARYYLPTRHAGTDARCDVKVDESLPRMFDEIEFCRRSRNLVTHPICELVLFTEAVAIAECERHGRHDHDFRLAQLFHRTIKRFAPEWNKWLLICGFD
jgi:hypothetical protein